MDTYSIGKGFSVPAVVTGKPIALGGSQGREDATSRGAVYTLLSTLRVLKIDKCPLDIVVQGFGNVGSNCAKILYDMGHKITGISDITGAIYNPKGIDIYDLSEHMKSRPLSSYNKAEV